MLYLYEKAGENMEKQATKYIQKHTFMMASLIIAAFLLLAVGEYILYRQQQHLNKMMSEGFMQMKEAQEADQSDAMMQESEPTGVMNR